MCTVFSNFFTLLLFRGRESHLTLFLAQLSPFQSLNEALYVYYLTSPFVLIFSSIHLQCSRNTFVQGSRISLLSIFSQFGKIQKAKHAFVKTLTVCKSSTTLFWKEKIRSICCQKNEKNHGFRKQEAKLKPMILSRFSLKFTNLLGKTILNKNDQLWCLLKNARARRRSIRRSKNDIFSYQIHLAFLLRPFDAR